MVPEFLQIEFDFRQPRVEVCHQRRAPHCLPRYAPNPSLTFYRELPGAASPRSALHVAIHPVPVELAESHPLRGRPSYTPAYDPARSPSFLAGADACADRVLQQFSSRFLGKVSPVHFFWGSFDLAVTRFSGRPAPARPEADAITREAYSREVISAGFWPGNGGFGEAAFYAYAAPAPKGLDEASIQPAKAHYDHKLGEFIYLYEDLRHEPSPDEALLTFLQSTYEAGANLAQWDRALLERP